MNTMKTALFTITLAVSSAVWAQGNPDATNAEPPELAARRAEYVQALRRAALPVMNNYVWTLEQLRQQFVRQSNLSAALAVEREIQKIKMEMASTPQAGSTGIASMTELTIVKATYGDHASGNATEVTSVVRAALMAGSASLALDTKHLVDGKDPAYGKPKTTLIVYGIDGRTKKKSFQEFHDLRFRDELK